jgi:hypothetical protein
MILHLTQPTKTSCGPTCVAMITGMPFDLVLNVLKASRIKDRGNARGTNIAEMTRMLGAFGWDVDRRLELKTDEDCVSALFAFGLLRVHRLRKSGKGHRTGWHWCVIANGVIHDPLMLDSMDAITWFPEAKDHKIYYYAVTRRKA